MQERLKRLLNKVLELWNKYTKKQRAILLSSVGVVAVMIFLLVYFLGMTTYVRCQAYDDLAKVQACDEALTSAGIAHRIGEDSATIYVDSTKTVQANLAVLNSPAMSDGRLTLSDLLNNDMSTTNADRVQKNAAYFQGQLEQQIERMVGIDRAKVSYIPLDRTSTILDEEKDIQCSVSLEVNSQFNRSMSEAIAAYVANALGNKSLETVKVIDQYGNLLYNGPEDDDILTGANQLALTKETYDFFQGRVTEYGLHLDFDYVDAQFNLKINFDRVEQYLKEYLPAAGQEQGLYGVYRRIQSENTSQNGDIPGTDGNDNTDYMLVDQQAGNSSYDDLSITYMVGEQVTKTMSQWGVVDPDASSMALVLKRIRRYTKDDLERLGELEGTTWEDYIVNHRDWERMDQTQIPTEFYEAFSNATGIPRNNISIIIYTIPEYIEEEEEGTNIDLILTIVLFVIIIALLIFVVFRVSKPEEVVETEPELSVEKLLATTKDNQSLEDIEFSEKSESKRLIEKFVDENPEAVAALLRNWLNDEWG
ncbi:MAG: hypothetical protein K2N94_10650 [Lachnospiraceae bacterium]|nr:hypothetical protein [Lachnospiraceae bacterium]